MKQIKLSFTEDYVGHWSWWQGARELMQNAIDTKDFDFDFNTRPERSPLCPVAGPSRLAPCSWVLQRSVMILTRSVSSARA